MKKIIKDFHKSRRMFVIFQNKLFIAKPNLSYSHLEWFQKERWTSKENEDIVNLAVRGFVNKKGNIYFYIGESFEINKNAEEIFFSHIKELFEKLNLRTDAKIFGGMIVRDIGEIWLPKKEYGEIKKYL